MPNIKMESNKDRKLIVRVHGQAEIDKTKKILSKIETKYKEKNVKVFEMSL